MCCGEGGAGGGGIGATAGTSGGGLARVDIPQLEDVDDRNGAIPGGMDAGRLDSKTETPTGARRERVVMERLLGPSVKDEYNSCK